MHIETFFSPAFASPFVSCAEAGAKAVAEATARANIVVNSLFILRAQSGEVQTLISL
ncbi:hypothetical protein ACFX58_10660 [Sphingomonas sp. NCPPB 2930]